MMELWNPSLVFFFWHVHLTGDWWLVLIYFERKVLLFGCSGCWFVLKQKYCELAVAYKPSEQP
jgi:hypothetical protein